MLCRRRSNSFISISLYVSENVPTRIGVRSVAKLRLTLNRPVDLLQCFVKAAKLTESNVQIAPDSSFESHITNFKILLHRLQEERDRLFRSID